MADLRALAEKDLGITLEGDWGLPVALLGPDGIWQRYMPGSTTAKLTGQVLYDTVSMNPETGERVVANVPIVTLRRSSLVRIPQPGERWIVEIPVDPTAGAPMTKFCISGCRPPEGGRSIGYIRLYLQAVEQA